jgi:putative membrane protein
MNRAWNRAWNRAGAALAVLCGALAVPQAALAHGGELHGPACLPTAWSLSPDVVLPLALVVWLYVRGTQRAHARGRAAPAREQAGFALGCLAVAIALISPLDALAAELASAHMVQHMLLIAVAPPLLAQGTPLRTLFWGLAKGARRPAGRLIQAIGRVGAPLTGPIAASSIHGIVIWGWHAPALYAAALADPVVHAIDHACLLGTGLLFWHTVLAKRPGDRGFGLGIVGLLATTIHTGMLGALMTFSHHPWYPELAGRTEIWGLTPLEDQQLAGLVMWVPMGFVYIGAATLLGAAWFAAMERRTRLAGSSPTAES